MDSSKTISLLRQRMIEDMRMRKLAPHTQAGYIRAVRKFARYLNRSPDTATAEDLRNFQLYLVDHGASPSARLTRIGVCRPAAVAMRKMIVAEARDDLLIGAAQIQLRALRPVAKVRCSIEIRIYGLPRVTALDQISLERCKGRSFPDEILERAAAYRFVLRCRDHRRLPGW